MTSWMIPYLMKIPIMEEKTPFKTKVESYCFLLTIWKKKSLESEERKDQTDINEENLKMAEIQKALILSFKLLNLGHTDENSSQQSSESEELKQIVKNSEIINNRENAGCSRG